MINVKAVKVSNFKATAPGGYKLLNGWTVANEAGELFSNNGKTPHLFVGNRKAAKSVEASGLLDGAQFISAQ